MKRREFVKAIVAASVSAKAMLGQKAAAPVAPSVAPPAAAPAPGPVPWMRGLLEVKPLAMTPLLPDSVAQTTARFFTPEQRAALHRLCEILLPPLKGYPGAVDAGTPEFLDFLISVSPAHQQHLYQSGLDRLNAEARKALGAPFASASAQQADQLLQPWLRTWMPDHPPADPFAHFINVAHSDIRTATINSQAWSQAGRRTPDVGLYWFPVDPDMRRQAPGQGEA
ncbi:MAG TPA: gluconate 2-dehydrogenase subunit 3 family protein [Acidobacteriaceae bacterium]